MSVVQRETEPRVPLQRAPEIPPRVMHLVAPAPVVTQAPEPRRNRARDLPRLAMVVDALVLGVAGLLVLMVGDLLPLWHPTPTGLLLTAPVSVLGPIAAIALAGGYQRSVVGAGGDEYRRVAMACLGAIGTVSVAFHLAQQPLGAAPLVLAAASGTTLMLLGRITLRASLTTARRNGSLRSRALIVGMPEHVDEVAAVLRRLDWMGYDIEGALVEDGDETELDGLPVLGEPSDVVAMALKINPDAVFFVGGGVTSRAHMRDIVWELESTPTQVVVVPSVGEVSSERVQMQLAGGLPLLHLDKPRRAVALSRTKRLSDVLLSSFLVVSLSPLFAFIALRIWAHDRGTVIFRQQRVGRNGEPFSFLKFRTMVDGAESMLVDLHASEGYTHGLFKMEDDPRITRPGRWLRRFSLDELPQLFNVLRGEMSLIGPRPPLEREVAQYDEVTTRRLRVRPGMTGLWQVSGRSDLSWAESVRLDLYYVDNCSLALDLHILARTVLAVLRPSGAY